MNQIVVYKGIMVEPLERSGSKILIRTKNPSDAKKADIPFSRLENGVALFETWAPETELVAVNS